MNSEIKRERLTACIQLAQDWKRSGMTQAEYAESKGLSLETVKYRIRKVREKAPEMLARSVIAETEFVPIPQEIINSPDAVVDEIQMVERPVLMIQSAGVCLQATNQIRPHLLRTALEVMLRC